MEDEVRFPRFPQISGARGRRRPSLGRFQIEFGVPGTVLDKATSMNSYSLISTQEWFRMMLVANSCQWFKIRPSSNWVVLWRRTLDNCWHKLASCKTGSPQQVTRRDNCTTFDQCQLRVLRIDIAKHGLWDITTLVTKHFRLVNHPQA